MESDEKMTTNIIEYNGIIEKKLKNITGNQERIFDNLGNNKSKKPDPQIQNEKSNYH